MGAFAAGDGPRRRRDRSWRPPAVLSVSVLLALSSGGTAIAAAAPRSASATTCSGTQTSPATLRGGTYSSVRVTGTCAVNGGRVVVTGNVTVEGRKAALLAAFAHNAHGGGTSGITVDGNLVVTQGGALLLGCFATSFPCIDDPNHKAPTLNSPAVVHGDLIATNSLGVIVHDGTISGDVRETDGGGGLTCTPAGIFNKFQSPVYSDYEDNTIGGNLWVSGLHSCWLGGIRNKVGGSVTYRRNKMADPDAMELETNQIRGNLICVGNSPATQIGDASGRPNRVGGFATGECGFGVRKPNPPAAPASPGPPPTPARPAGPLEHISMPAREHHGYDLGAARRRSVCLRVAVLRVGDQHLADVAVRGHRYRAGRAGLLARQRRRTRQ